MSESVYIQSLKKDPKKYAIFLRAKKMGLISEFDDELKTKLRRIYYGGYIDCLTYLYFMDTDFETIGNKVEIMCKALEDQEYYFFHALTDSVKNIHFNEYGRKHLDYDTFFEVKKGNNTWVYDMFSLLKFDKDVFYELEHPETEMTPDNFDQFLSVPTSAKIAALKAALGEDDYTFRCKEFYVDFVDVIMFRIEEHPYEAELRNEIDYQKQILGYEKIKFVKQQEELRDLGFTGNILTVLKKR